MARERNRRIFLSAGTGVFQRLVQGASTLLVMPILLAVLGPARFGVWGAITSLAWLHGLLDLGVGQALVTHVARSEAIDRRDETRRLIIGAFGLGSLLAFAIIAIGVAVVPAFVPQPKATLYLIAIVAMALNIPLNSANSAWMGLQKGHVSGFWDLAQTVVTAAGLLIASTFSSDVRVYVAVVYGGLVLSNIASLVHLFLELPELAHAILPDLWPSVRNIAGRGMSYFLLSLACALSYLLDNVLALELLGPEAAARMAIAVRICMTAWGLLEVVSMPLWPAFAEAGVKSDRTWIGRSMLRGASVIAGGAATGGALLVALGPWILRLWLRSDLGIDRGLLLAIAAWVLAQAINRVPNVFLNATSVVGFQVAVNSAATLAAFVLKFTLAPSLGPAGILWGTTAATLLIVVPANLWRVARWRNADPVGEAPAMVAAS